MTVIEKVAYLKGLADGLGLDPENKTDKLIKAVIDVLDDMALSVCDLEDNYAEVVEQLDAVDEDLSMLEDDFYEDDDDDDEDYDDDEDFYEVKCPQCGDVIYLDDDMLEDGSIDCPNCGTELEFDFTCDCDDDECDCGEEEKADE